MPKEEWRDVKGWEGKYQVSSYGRVRSVPRKVKVHAFGKGWGERETKCVILSTGRWMGYPTVELKDRSKGMRSRQLVHRLIAEVFIPNPENKPQVNHKNGNRADNMLSNLEWCTRSENCQHRNHVLGVETPNKGKVKCVETGVVYKNGKEASRQTGICYCSINRAANNKPKYKTAGGYHWELVDEMDQLKYKRRMI